ncbi:hypothetical protein M758_3G101700 [Ceratodon purpureus]|nr:hypothetical protein M758_3G101700 [Ceratodon purpureus]
MAAGNIQLLICNSSYELMPSFITGLMLLVIEVGMKRKVLQKHGQGAQNYEIPPVRTCQFDDSLPQVHAKETAVIVTPTQRTAEAQVLLVGVKVRENLLQPVFDFAIRHHNRTHVLLISIRSK